MFTIQAIVGLIQLARRFISVVKSWMGRYARRYVKTSGSNVCPIGPNKTRMRK
jgi:hypothetical protein